MDRARAADPWTGPEVAEALALDSRQRQRLTDYARHRFEIEATAVPDLLQETMMELLRRPGGIQSPEPYVRRVFHVRCCRLVGREVDEREGRLAMPEPPRAEEVPDTRLLVAQALRSQPRRHRKLLSMYFLTGHTVHEIARELSVAPASVRQLVRRCLLRMRADLETTRRVTAGGSGPTPDDPPPHAETRGSSPPASGPAGAA